MASEYRLVTFAAAGAPPCGGVLVDDRVHGLAAVLDGCNSVLEALRDWPASHAAIMAWIGADAAGRGQGHALAAVTLLAPVQYPANFFCAGANYWDHLKEMGDFIEKATGKAPSLEKAAEPWLFVKTTAGTIVGDGAAVELPAFSQQVDWEAELGVVIGRTVKNVAVADARDAIAGYLIVNDLSARDLIRRAGSPFIYDWIGQKCFDGAAPMGPWLTPAAFVPDPAALDIRLWLNGALKQSSSTSQMVHSIEELVAYLSRHVTLFPGDIIATGTPAGVGMPANNYLAHGDRIEIEIASLGRLTHSTVRN